MIHSLYSAESIALHLLFIIEYLMLRWVVKYNQVEVQMIAQILPQRTTTRRVTKNMQSPWSARLLFPFQLCCL